MNHLVVGLIALAVVNSASALSPAEQDRLSATVKELCLFPDRSTEIVKAEGGASVGAPVLLKFLKADVNGKVTYETWKGFGAALDKYKTDPRQCSIEMVKLLLPTMLSSPTPVASQSSSDSNFPITLFLRRGSIDSSHLPELPSTISIVITNPQTGNSVAFVKVGNDEWYPSEARLQTNSSNVRYSVEARFTNGGSTSTSTCTTPLSALPTVRYELTGLLGDGLLAMADGMGGLLKLPSGPNVLPTLPKLVSCRFMRAAN